MHVSHHAASNENVLHTAKMRVLGLVENGNVVKFNVEILIDGFESATDADVVFEFDCDGVGGEGFEEAGRQLTRPFLRRGWKL